MHVHRIPNGKYRPVTLIRQSYREDGQVKKRTLGNISYLPEHIIDSIQHQLKGKKYVALDEVFKNIGAKSHGHVQAVLLAIKRLGLANLIASRRSRERDLVVAMIAARLMFAQSKHATVVDWTNTTLAEELEVEDATEDDLYAAMDWLFERKERIEGKLVARHLNPGDIVLHDLSSSYIEGIRCPLSSYGHNRDKKRGKQQINYGLVTDVHGRPLIIDAYPGNTSDSTTVLPLVKKIRDTYGLKKFVLVGDRGMLTNKNIKQLNSLDGVDWISALRSTSIKKLVEQKNLQMDLFDERDLFEFISESDYPGERLIACRNSSLMLKRTAERESLIGATEKDLQGIAERVKSGRLKDKEKIGLTIGKVINKYKMGKHFILDINDAHFTFRRNEKSIQQESMLDGVYIIRTSLKYEDFDSYSCVRSYKDLSKVEKAFRAMKSIDLRIRPIHHYRENRVRTHFFLCMLSYYVEWHMRQAWEELTFTDQDKDLNENPVSSAVRSASAKRKDSTKRNENGMQVRSFKGVMKALEALPMNTYRSRDNKSPIEFKMPAGMNPIQERAMELLQIKIRGQ